MHEDALDDTVLLCFLGQRDQTLVGVVVVGSKHAFHPTWSNLEVVGDAVGHESLNADAADGYVDDTYADVLGQVFNECTAKVVGGCQTGVGTAEWGRGLTPFALLTVTLRVINGRHQQETRSRAGNVLCLGACSTLHV